ncbi:probable cytochrome P450 313a1 [Diaphorina citri]|uniref:Probable cytochrome P450 313a1 n=1 Tax=Diaphorina citri TaxID=121845 RepID=A0A3Q0J2G1_DIACI|nr:probable cytochrome P450 313a1 [Diaphorina citri]
MVLKETLRMSPAGIVGILLIISFYIYIISFFKVYDEIIQTLGDNTSTCPSYEDLMKLDYLEMVLKETLRMSPAGIGTARKVTEDIKVTSSDGKQYTFPTGVTIVTVAEHIHRSSHYYDLKQFKSL